MDSEKNKSVDAKEDQQGYVYILTNPSFKDDWVKIESRTHPVEPHSKELKDAAVPLPFEIYASLKTSKYEKVEKLMQKQIDSFAIRYKYQNRKFFYINPETALEVMCEIADLLEDPQISIPDTGGVYVISRSEKDINANDIKPPLRFSTIGLKEGDTITFDPLKIKLKIYTNYTIKYEGSHWSLAGFSRKYLPKELQAESDLNQCLKYFSYKGKTLADIRKEKKKQTP